MPDLSSVAREAARAEAEAWLAPPQRAAEHKSESPNQWDAGFLAGARFGGEAVASRIPSEEELARVIDVAIYVSINPLLDRGAWKAAQRAARDVASLIGERISG